MLRWFSKPCQTNGWKEPRWFLLALGQECELLVLGRHVELQVVCEEVQYFPEDNNGKQVRHTHERKHLDLARQQVQVVDEVVVGGTDVEVFSSDEMQLLVVQRPICPGCLQGLLVRCVGSCGWPCALHEQFN